MRALSTVVFLVAIISIQLSESCRLTTISCTRPAPNADFRDWFVVKGAPNDVCLSMKTDQGSQGKTEKEFSDTLIGVTGGKIVVTKNGGKKVWCCVEHPKQSDNNYYMLCTQYVGAVVKAEPPATALIFGEDPNMKEDDEALREYITANSNGYTYLGTADVGGHDFAAYHRIIWMSHGIMDQGMNTIIMATTNFATSPVFSLRTFAGAHADATIISLNCNQLRKSNEDRRGYYTANVNGIGAVFTESNINALEPVAVGNLIQNYPGLSFQNSGVRAIFDYFHANAVLNAAALKRLIFDSSRILGCLAAAHPTHPDKALVKEIFTEVGYAAQYC